MRVAVMGAGALGGYFGGQLARAGEDVTFIARGTHLAAIQRDGLRVRAPEIGDFTTRAAATSDPGGIGTVDLVIFAVKNYDLAAAAEAIRPIVGARTVVLPVQNGIDVAERIARAVGEEAVIGGVSYTGGTIEAPGVILVNGARRTLYFGELAGGQSPRVERLLAAFLRAGIQAESHANIRQAMWEKFVAICGNAGMTALTRLPVGSLMACAESRAMYQAVMEEVVAVARAHGVTLAQDTVDQLMGILGRMDPTTRASMANDLNAGRRLELEYLHGTLVRMAQASGVLTPLNWAIYAALKPYVDGPPALPS